MLIVGRPVVALFRTQPGTPMRCSFGLVRWAVEMSAWIMAVATVFPGGGYRHRLGINARTLGLPDPGGGC